MRVDTIGGGPGGLYASLLLKKARPDWEVTVYERNPADVTYGWGIVFPNRTLSNLREADRKTHEEITDSFYRWEPFDTYVDGERYRCGGHTFASMMRTTLLDLLQDRCREVGVDLQFETEIENPDRLAADADVVIGADGIHSRTRERYAESFGTDLVHGDAWFSWFGTNADFEALSHVFVENDDGIWCAHTYPGPTNTFIVDCDPETWANSGLADASEAEYLDYVEGVFEEYLDGEELLSELDRWQTFTTVRNESWHHENVALVGDAAHTAHYSIGSGTTLAMEGAIALAEALERHEDPGVALPAYEASRKPFVERLQRAGERSRIHFENIRRFYDMAPRQFVVHHLTRSGRLTYDSLAGRDPEFVAALDRWFAAESPGVPGDSAPGEDPGSPLYQPYALGDLTVENRVVGVLEPTITATEGTPRDPTVDRLVDRATGGAGLVLTEPLAVSPDGRIARGSPGLYEDDHGRAWGSAVDQVHDETDAATGAVLSHAGRRAASRPAGLALDRPDPNPDARSPPAPSPIPYSPTAPRPEPMDEEDLTRVKEAFAGGARRADDAGFDLLLLHAGNGYLLSQFLSPLTNEREDAYGGSPSDRMRYPLEVFDAVRDAWPDGKPIGVVLQATDWTAGGIELEDAFGVAEALSERGCDLVAPVAGGTIPDESPDPLATPGWYADDVRNGVGIPTLATRYVTSEDAANTLVATGRADLCAIYGSVGSPDPE